MCVFKKILSVVVIILGAYVSVFAAFPTASEIANEMTIGWNIGNTMESFYIDNNTDDIVAGEGCWGNPNITQTLIDSVKAAGFNTIRIPTGWDIHATNGIIDQSWLARVKEVIDYCYKNDMYVLLNIHWDRGWLENNCTTDKKDEVNAKQASYWNQIATYYKDYDEHLLFASANEPAVENAEQMSVLLSYHQTFVNTVRATGGNNSERILVVQGPVTDMEKTYNLMNTLPTDTQSDRMMVEVHFYSPFQYCLKTDGDGTESWEINFYTWGNGYHSTTDTKHNPTWGEEDFIDEWFGKMKSKFVDKGYPVIIGEFGANTRKHLSGAAYDLHVASREYYYRYLTRAAKENSLIPVYWDTGDQTSDYNFTLFDRNSGSTVDKGALNALMAGTYGTDAVVRRSNDCNGVFDGNSYYNDKGDCVIGYVQTQNSPPTVSIVSPLDKASSYVNNQVTISANVDDDKGISQVVFFATNKTTNSMVEISTVTEAPYSCNWTPSDISTYYLVAKATDTDGETVTSNIITYYVTEQLPITFIYSETVDKLYETTANWSSNTLPSATDSAIIQSGEAQLRSDLENIVVVKSDAIFRMVGYYSVAGVVLQGGTLQVNTSNDGYGLKSDIYVNNESNIKAGDNSVTKFYCDASFTGENDLNKVGAGSLILQKESKNYNGSWSIKEGGIALKSKNSTGNGSIKIEPSAQLLLQVNGGLSGCDSLIVNSGAKVVCDVLDSVYYLKLGEQDISPGDYQSTDYPDFISGNGTLTVLKGVIDTSVIDTSIIDTSIIDTSIIDTVVTDSINTDTTEVDTIPIDPTDPDTVVIVNPIEPDTTITDSITTDILIIGSNRGNIVEALPNPMTPNGFIRYDIKQSKSSRIVIYSDNAKKVGQQKLISNKGKIDWREFNIYERGIYTAVIYSGSREVVRVKFYY